MKVLFHAEQLNYRGTTNSVVDYARYNQEILGNESAIIYDIDSSGIAGFEIGSNPKVIEYIKTLFSVYTYNSVDQLNDIASKFDVCYSQRAGVKVDHTTLNGKKIVKPIVTSTKFGVHAVFQWYEPHGDVYAYISEWLSKAVHKNYGTKELPPFVPYIVDLPQPIWNMRQMLGIPEDKIVIGRLGGFDTFDIEFVKRTVYDIVNERDDIVFLFAHTLPFYTHPNIIHVDAFFDQQTKSDFICSCDAMLHGRELGESFGLAISEFLFHNKPVLAWSGGFDKNHVHMLQRTGLLYDDEKQLREKLLSIRDYKNGNYAAIVESFTPSNVMRKFQQVFL